MIMTVNECKQRVNCGTLSDDQIRLQLDAIEAVIRAYTNNNFQNRAVRFCGRSTGSDLVIMPSFLKAGDTVQISESINNNGLYVITAVADDHITVDRELWDDFHNLITLISYPADVVQCAVDLFNWKTSKGDKVGIKSETLSRHSVSYEDSAQLYMGFPIGILNGLRLWKKVRF